MKKIFDKILCNKNFEKFIISLILINLLSFTLQTDSDINKYFYRIFDFVEVFSVMVFSIEYIMRICTLKSFKQIFGFYMVVDFLAIAPFYLSFLALNTTFIRALRLFRLFRIAKLTRYDDAIKNIIAAFSRRKYELIITGWICILAVFLSSTLIYFAENQTGNPMFASIPRSCWWSIITVTSVGYGDATPITACGKFIAGFTAIFGVGLHGLLIGLISTSFMDAINFKAKQKRAFVGEKAQNKEKQFEKL